MRLLEFIENFLLQEIQEPTRRGVMLHLVSTKREGLMGNWKLKGSLGSSDHEMVEFKIFRLVRRVASFLYCISEELMLASSDICLVEYHRTQESWLIFKHCFLQAAGWYIPKKQARRVKDLCERARSFWLNCNRRSLQTVRKRTDNLGGM